MGAKLSRVDVDVTESEGLAADVGCYVVVSIGSVSYKTDISNSGETAAWKYHAFWELPNMAGVKLLLEIHQVDGAVMGSATIPLSAVTQPWTTKVWVDLPPNGGKLSVSVRITPPGFAVPPEPIGPASGETEKGVVSVGSSGGSAVAASPTGGVGRPVAVQSGDKRASGDRGPRGPAVVKPVPSQRRSISVQSSGSGAKIFFTQSLAKAPPGSSRTASADSSIDPDEAPRRISAVNFRRVTPIGGVPHFTERATVIALRRLGYEARDVVVSDEDLSRIPRHLDAEVRGRMRDRLLERADARLSEVLEMRKQMLAESPGSQSGGESVAGGERARSEAGDTGLNTRAALEEAQLKRRQKSEVELLLAAEIMRERMRREEERRFEAERRSREQAEQDVAKARQAEATRRKEREATRRAWFATRQRELEERQRQLDEEHARRKIEDNQRLRERQEAMARAERQRLRRLDELAAERERVRRREAEEARIRLLQEEGQAERRRARAASVTMVRRAEQEEKMARAQARLRARREWEEQQRREMAEHADASEAQERMRLTERRKKEAKERDEEEATLLLDLMEGALRSRVERAREAWKAEEERAQRQAREEAARASMDEMRFAAERRRAAAERLWAERRIAMDAFREEIRCGVVDLEALASKYGIDLEALRRRIDPRGSGAQSSARSRSPMG